MSPITLNKDSIDRLNDLIRINFDSAAGFVKAAELIEDDSELSNLLRCMSLERRGFAEELKGMLWVEGDPPPETSSWEGKIHRWWLQLRTKLQPNDRYAVLAEAERGEDKIKAEYEKAIDEVDDRNVHLVLVQQYRLVCKDHDNIRSLRDQAKEG